MPVSMFGVVWPDVRQHFGQSLGALGLVSLVYGVARMSTCASGSALIRRFGMSTSFIGALTLLSATCVAVASSTSWLRFLAGVAGVGVASGMLDSVGAAFIIDLADISRTGLVHGSYGVGATLGPLIVAVVSGWRVAMFVSALTVSGAIAVAARARHDWPTIEHHHASTRAGVPLSRLPAALSLGLFATFVAIEVTTGQWAYTYLTDHRGIGGGVAAVGIAGFWGGLTIGRLGLARRSVSEFTARVGLPTFALAGGGLLAALTVLPAVLGAGVLGLAGLVLAPIVPSLFATTSQRIGAAHAQRMAGWQLLAANAGAIVAPSLTGALVDRVGPGVVVIVIAALTAVGVPLLVAITRSPARSVEPIPDRSTERAGSSRPS